MSNRFDWKEYLALAKSLKSSTPRGQTVSNANEAKNRCAVSRAYYAAFNIADAYARDSLSYSPSGEGSDHKKLTDFYSDRYESTRTPAFLNIAGELQTMRLHRRDADYRAGKPITDETAETCIYSAEDVIQYVEQLART